MVVAATVGGVVGAVAGGVVTMGAGIVVGALLGAVVPSRVVVGAAVIVGCAVTAVVVLVAISSLLLQPKPVNANAANAKTVDRGANRFAIRRV